MAAMETLASLARSELPEALQELNQKHVYINDVIQWCETSYQTGNKKEVQAQTKEYLVDSLESVAKEVENVADKLSDFLTLQGNALDDLGTMLELINEKLDVAKAQNAADRLAKFRQDVGAPAPREAAARALTDDERKTMVAAVAPYDPCIANRFDSFDDCGECLQKR